MKPGRIVALVVGCVLVLPGLGLLVGGSVLAIGYSTSRDNQGYLNTSLDRLETSSVAITTEHADFGADVEGPDRLFDALDVTVRLRATPARGQPIFLGIAPSAAVDAYLAGTAHDVVADVGHGGTVTYRHVGGGLNVAAPIAQGFWARSAAGTGTLRLTWPVRSGSWSAVLMNADGSPVVAADVEVGVKAGFVLPLAFLLIGFGLLLLLIGVVLIIVALTGGQPSEPGPAGSAGGSVGASAGVTPVGSAVERPDTPVTLTASLDPALSRWQWLVKWLLAIPHFVILICLWVVYFVLTVVVFFAILFTGRYPRGIFDFNVGVLRWTWRVSYYATTGGLGTDHYPPFSVAPQEGEYASLDVAYPDQQLSRGLVLVKWWLLAIPHYLVLAVLVGGSAWWAKEGEHTPYFGGLLSLLVFFAAVALLFTGRYPRSLFVLVIGLNRWLYRVIAYVSLMTDTYPPFRLDQGGDEPVTTTAVNPR